jgi:hypothetical protein
MRKLLSILLFLSGAMPLFLGSMILMSYPDALPMLKIADSPDVFQAVSLFGICLISLGILQWLAGYWTWQNNWSGIVLARYSGLLILMDGLVIYSVLHRPDLGVPDIIKGLIITIVAFLVKKK